MALPMMRVPAYETLVPSTKKKVKFRPFLIREQKGLMLAQQSESTAVMFATMTEVVKSCILDGLSSKDIDELAYFDIEYLFLQIRAKSVGETSDLYFNCLSCNDPKAIMKITLDLTELKVIFPKDMKNTFDIDEIGVTTKYPSFETIEKLKNQSQEDPTILYDAVAESIDTIYNETNVYNASDYTEDELKEFVNNLTPSQFSKIASFLNNLPDLSKTIEFKCPVCGAEHKRLLKGINDFF